MAATRQTKPTNELPSRLAPSATPRRAFTLIELLVTIAVIGIMASMMLFAMVTVQEKAKVEKTKGMIAKLNTMLMQRYESYHTRRVPIAILPTDTPGSAATKRLDGLRELMRMEIPEKWADIIDPPVSLSTRPTISQAYLRRYNAIAAKATNPALGNNQSAECLYLILTSGTTDEIGGRELFNEGEVGDTDGDGALEFLDAWGTPICFLRWAPGSITKEPEINDWSPTLYNQLPDGYVDELQNGKDPDPFDSRHVYLLNTFAVGNATPPAPRFTYALFPLIFSAGPDKKYDIATDLSPKDYGTPFNPTAPHGVNNDPYYTTAYSRKVGAATVTGVIGQEGVIGAPAQTDGNGTQWKDNITNHMLGTK